MMQATAGGLHARNLEFLRDRATLAWNLLLPIALVIGLAVIFGGPERPLFKVGVLHGGARIDARPHPFLRTHYVEFFGADATKRTRVRKVARHQMDLLLDLRGAPRYWVNTDSPKGYIVEKLLLESDPAGAEARAGERRCGALRRLAAARHPRHEHHVQLPVRRRLGGGALSQERLPQAPARDAAARHSSSFAAQVLSRLLLTMVVTALVFVGLRIAARLPAGRQRPAAVAGGDAGLDRP